MLELLLFLALIVVMIVLPTGLSVLAKRLILKLARGPGTPVRWGALWIASLCEIPIIIFVFIVAWCPMASDPQILRERPELFFVALCGSVIVLHALFALFPHMSLLKKMDAVTGQDAPGNNNLGLAFLLGLPLPPLAIAALMVALSQCGSLLMPLTYGPF